MSKLEQDTDLFLPPDLRSKLTSVEAKRRGTILKKLYFGNEQITSDNVPKLIEVSVFFYQELFLQALEIYMKVHGEKKKIKDKRTNVRRCFHLLIFFSLIFFFEF